MLLVFLPPKPRSAGSRGTSSSGSASSGGSASKKKTEADLPVLSAKTQKLMNRLMMSDEYEIKPDYGFLNFLFQLSSKNKEKVTRRFGGYTIKKHVDHLQNFVTAIKSFIQYSPDEYKSQIATETALKFKFLRTVGRWTMKNLKGLQLDIEESKDDLTVPQLIPYVKELYKMLLTIYYIGEQAVANVIKEIFADLLAYPDIERNKVQTFAKQAMTEWVFVYNQIIKGTYPLLMRMCSTEYVEFPTFFTQQLTQILSFVGLSKFDVLLPEKKQKPQEEKKAEAEEKKKPEEKRHVAGEKDEVVSSGLKLLEQLFPSAGFENLSSHPDMYPYFQPLYNFEEGFNMLSPENGLQVTIVLLKVVDDLFHGCRNINFNIQSDEKLSALSDTITGVMADWGFYMDDLFIKNYGDYLKEFMNSFYTQPDYPSTQYGKENVNNLLWRAKLDFLPALKFSAPTLSKPRSDNKYRSLYSRTDYLRTVLTTLAHRIDENAPLKKPVDGVENPWARYTFDIPNVVSKRLDVLLGAKKDDSTTGATNANLIKYTLCIVAVLDWWINNPESPAYTTDAMHFYRAASDGSPEFSADLRSDQNALFAQGVKKAVAKAMGKDTSAN